MAALQRLKICGHDDGDDGDDHHDDHDHDGDYHDDGDDNDDVDDDETDLLPSGDVADVEGVIQDMQPLVLKIRNI